MPSWAGGGVAMRISFAGPWNFREVEGFDDGGDAAAGAYIAAQNQLRFNDAPYDCNQILRKRADPWKSGISKISSGLSAMNS